MNRTATLFGLGALVVVVATIADCTGGTPASHAVAVVDRSYAPAATWCSNGIDSKGKQVFTSHYEGEHWRVVVRDGDRVRAVDVGPAVWSCAGPGSSLTESYRVGRWTGIHYNGSLTVPAPPEAAP